MGRIVRKKAPMKVKTTIPARIEKRSPKSLKKLRKSFKEVRLSSTQGGE